MKSFTQLRVNHTTHRANDEIWTRDLFLTKEALYPWATPALNGMLSGRRDSNSRRSAWKAEALPTELLPLNTNCGESRIRTCEGMHQQIYSLFSLATWVSPQYSSRWRDSNPRPADYKSAALANWATSANDIFVK